MLEDTRPTLIHLCIRSVTEVDLPALEWDGEYTHFRRIYAEAFQRQQQGLAVLWVAELPRRGLIGQVFVQFTCDRQELADGKQRAYLYSFRVKPAYRSLGVGTRLLDMLIQDLRQRGYHQLTLNVAKDNPRAHTFYARHGFDVVANESGNWSYQDNEGVWHDVHEPAWRMLRSLG
jgi:ribosomal protein S18 acetylase RimI-like enzyme